MYVVRSGNVEIERNGEVIETLSGGSIFGEMALIDGSPRSATARAKTACELAPISEKSFLFLVHETPFFAIAVMRTLAERLRRSRAPTLICRGVGHPPLPIFALHCRSRRP
jgi:CRP/FNR family cyclic AMP-dependent transcriptional regulator